MTDKPELGRRIKAVREAKHYTLKAIEASAGISATHISEIERGKTSPTLGALLRISKALGKDPAYFIEDEDLGEFSLVTRENRLKESLPQGIGTIERLTMSIPGGRLQAILVTLAPGKSRHSKPHSHYGNEAAVVLSGAIRFTCGGQPIELDEGDAIHYFAEVEHGYENASKLEEASMIWVCTERNAT